MRHYDQIVESLLEVELESPDKFLVIKETLTRIGVASNKDKTIYQSCHILHKQHRYFIVHFKELFLLDGKSSSISESDIQRRNTIALLLDEWGLLNVLDPDKYEGNQAPMSGIKILPYKDKADWKFESKYTIGRK